MKTTCEKKRSSLTTFMRSVPAPTAGQMAIAQHLYTVVDAFIEAYEQREKADYDNSKQWTRTEVLAQIATVRAAFDSWRQIRHESLAQEYLVHLLVKVR